MSAIEEHISAVKRSMIVPFSVFLLMFWFVFVSVMYCVVQNNKLSRLILIVGFFLLFYFLNSEILPKMQFRWSPQRASRDLQECWVKVQRTRTSAPSRWARTLYMHYTDTYKYRSLLVREGGWSADSRSPCSPQPAPSSLWSLIPESLSAVLTGMWNHALCRFLTVFGPIIPRCGRSQPFQRGACVPGLFHVTRPMWRGNYSSKLVLKTAL